MDNQAEPSGDIVNSLSLAYEGSVEVTMNGETTVIPAPPKYNAEYFKLKEKAA